MPFRATRKNIETVANLEQESLRDRSLSERISDAIAGFAGTLAFFIVHVAGFALWAAVNSGRISFIRPFDPYPYAFLTMAVSLEGVLVATFVLIKQNRMSRRAERRDHLMLQVDLLAERELTKLLQMQRLICAHLGLEQGARDAEAEELSAETPVDALAEEVKRRMPED
jgi:uncharacterized membrane protein